MNAHIINIADEGYFLNTCIPNGFLGAGIYINGITPQKLSRACLTTYSMYADMKTLHTGDVVFVHAGTKIYGPFRTTSEFMEDSATPPDFISPNIHYYPKPGMLNTGWQNRIAVVPNLGDYRRVGITNVIDAHGNSLSYPIGIESTELFELKYQGKIFSIPERWKYADAARTIRPLFEFEADEIIKIIELKNADTHNRFQITPLNIGGYLPIDLILDNNIVENEKIIEGWLLSQFGRNANVDNIFGEFTSFCNNVPIGYLKFIDILGYKQLPSGLRKYRVVEVKKYNSLFPVDVYQLIGYMNSVSTILCNNNNKLVEGIIVANGFHQDCIDFIRHYNGTERTIKLVEFRYSGPHYNQLQLTQVV